MLMICPECGKKVSDTAKTCPHCGAPVKKQPKQATSEVTLIIECKKHKSFTDADRFHVLVNGSPIGLARYDEPFKFRISQPSTLSIKLKEFMEYRTNPINLEIGKDTTVRFEVSRSSVFRLTKYFLKEIK